MFCDDSERPIADVETIYKSSSLKAGDYMDIFRTQTSIYDWAFCESSSRLSAFSPNVPS